MAKFLVSQFFSQFTHFERHQKKFILLAFLCSFLISSDYSIIRPAANAIFISSWGTKYLPYAWLFAVPFNFFLVSLYNKFLPRFGNAKIMMITIISIIFVNTIFSYILKIYPEASFVFYIWKEVYILLMFQQLWSEILTHFQLNQAKFFYGCMYGMGALGSTLGSLIPSFLALNRGSENLLLATLPIYIGIGVAFSILIKTHVVENKFEKKQYNSDPLAGLKLILKSNPLVAILCIVVFMQVASTLTDYQFNAFLAEAYTTTDLRTEHSARVLSFVHIFTLILQFVGSYLIIEWLGVRRGHIAIPLVLFLNSLSVIVFPSFTTASLCYICIKTLDFSLFSVLKEMLYLPLKIDEKYRAKSFIDVFAYRGSKSIASILILLLQAFMTSQLVSVISYANAALFLLWVLCVTLLLREHKKSEMDS